ncbi:MBL fold metallo-hydrolase [Pokkaliibacter sp. CJK22405]|uniref:MBL fold metallo-hydrolase n=1 Tax=Pokkaliibacter sp. CJK22405 TaxID=3384615 RepID=UPI0039846341
MTVSTRSRSAMFARTMAITGALITALGVVAPAAYAKAPMVKTQAGYYRTMLGNFEVTVLSDGTNPLPADKLLKGIAPDELNALLKQQHLTNPVTTSVNEVLINTGEKLILIDTGTGGMGPTNGRMLKSLKNAGYSPEQVDEIYITHMHPDHVGGLSHEGERVFPNAVVKASEVEANYWLDEDTMAKAPEGKQRGFAVAMEEMEPYQKAGAFQTFSSGALLSPGITAQAEFGHTPGHETYTIESEGQKLIVLGDLIHFAAVQFAHPEYAVGFDSDDKEAIAARKAVFDHAAENGTLVVGAHLPFPGLGYINKSDNGYQWVPINYSLAE